MSSRSVLHALLLPVLLLTACQTRFVPAAPGLVATVWRVTDLQGEPFSPPVDAPDNPRPYTLVLEASGHIRAHMGCNDMQGDYQHNGRMLRIGPQLATHRLCSEEAMRMEKRRRWRGRLAVCLRAIR